LSIYFITAKIYAVILQSVFCDKTKWSFRRTLHKWHNNWPSPFSGQWCSCSPSRL